jgi:hypothetical protein
MARPNKQPHQQTFTKIDCNGKGPLETKQKNLQLTVTKTILYNDKDAKSTGTTRTNEIYYKVKQTCQIYTDQT